MFFFGGDKHILILFNVVNLFKQPPVSLSLSLSLYILRYHFNPYSLNMSKKLCSVNTQTLNITKCPDVVSRVFKTNSSTSHDLNINVFVFFQIHKP